MSATRTAPAASSAASRQWQLGQPIWNLTLNTRGDWVVGALGNGSLVVLPSDDAGEDPRVMEAHKGVSLELCADADDHAFLSGGDDGQLLLVDPQLAVPTILATQPQGRWIDHVAASADGFRAYARGKTLFRLNEEGQEQVPPFALPSSIGGLAFSPNGKRLAVAHYGGVSLFW
ncbi:MAG TPA: WD40 repeat domain-containing protein, partial [Rhodospirillaceae bacterium]|nr:WD40 repeat domain-containing protein [Rhodospirillaceae bacterium]